MRAIVFCLVIASLITMPVTASVGYGAAPKGAVKLPKTKTFRLADFDCGNVKGKSWVVGSRVSGGYFYPYKAEKNNLTAELKKASKKRKQSIEKRLAILNSLIPIREPICAEGPTPTRSPKLSAGMSHVCFLDSNGAVKCWGRNHKGQLGDGTTTNRSTPTAVTALGIGNRDVFAGGAHTCVLTRLYTVACFGANGLGQLGDGSTTDRSTPVNVIGIDKHVVKLIDRADDNTCAIVKNGAVKCWGSNEFGSLGDGTTTNRSTPVDVIGLPYPVLAISSGWSSTCALTDPGGIQCWGINDEGQLGDGTRISRPNPSGVLGLSGSANVKDLVVAGWHACAVTNSGAGKCWGENWMGVLGDGSSDVFTTLPRDISGLSTEVVMITAESQHNCALLTSGQVYCWGKIEGAPFGGQRTPVEISGLMSGVKSISAGSGFTCALSSSNRVQCWGNNDEGQFGNGTTFSSPVPTDALL